MYLPLLYICLTTYSFPSTKYLLNLNSIPTLKLIQPLLHTFSILQHLINLINISIKIKLNLFLYYVFYILKLFIYLSELWFYLRVQMTTSTHNAIVYGVKNTKGIWLNVVYVNWVLGECEGRAESWCGLSYMGEGLFESYEAGVILGFLLLER